MHRGDTGAGRWRGLAALACAAACRSGATPEPAACVGDAGGAGVACVQRVEGHVVDGSGAPVPRAAVSMCSRTCYGAAGGDDGRFAIPIGAYLRASDYALHVSGRPGFADVYAKVPDPSGDVIFLGAAVKLPALPASGPSLPPSPAGATTLASGPLSLDLPAGVTFQLDVADVALGPLGRQLRVASVPLGAAPDFARGLSGVVALYALAPSGAAASSPLGVHLLNDVGLPASAAFALDVLDDDYRPVPPTAGTARRAATGHVSVDGRTLDTDAGQGITRLTWLVVRTLP